MTFGTCLILLTIWKLIFITGITHSLSSMHSDSRIREVLIMNGTGQMIECPGQSRITILFSSDLFGKQINECGNDFYEFYVNRRCTFKRRCEFPRFNDALQKKCPGGNDTPVKLKYKCVHGKEVVRLAKLSLSQTLVISCPFDTSIHLMKAIQGNKAENCYYKMAFQFIDQSCRYKKKCTVEFRSIPTTWKCREIGDAVEIDYTCQNYTVNVVSALKGESLTLQCPIDYMIDIQSANYSSGNGKCLDPLAEVTVIDRCSTKNRCTFHDDVSRYFMNFCFQGRKRLEVAYSCVKINDTKKFIVFQDGMLDLACIRGQTIQILSAKYGNDDRNCWSITTQTRLIEKCEGKVKCCAYANDDFLGVSKCPKNTRKSLTVIYRCQAISNLDTLENVDLEESTGKVCENIRFELAASFGRLTSETIKTMDRELLVMIGGSLPKLKEMNVGTFDDVIGYMKNIEFLSANENSYTERYDSFNNTEVGIKDFIDRENVKFQAVSWYQRLIGNADILSETEIDIDELSHLVTTVGASANSIKTSVFNREGGNQTVVDMAILRFPDFKNPFFLIYNIKLTAWWQTSRLLFFEKARSGMSGLFRSIRFLPNHEFISTSEEELIDKAMNEINSLFNMPLV